MGYLKKISLGSIVLELGLRQIDVVCQHDEYLKIRFQIGRLANPAASLVLAIIVAKREKTLQILDSEIKDCFIKTDTTLY